MSEPNQSAHSKTLLHGMSTNTADEGHLKRLDALERQLTHHRDIVDALRTRLQRLKPAGQSTPPKARRHHRHTRSDPTPQPAPASSAPSPRPSQRRSHGKSNQRKGGHGKSCSVQTGSIQGQKEHLILEREEVVEEDDGPGRVANPAESSFRISDGVWVRDALVRGLVTECSGGGTAERVEDSSCQEESIAGPVSQREDERSVLSSGISMRYPAVDTKKTSPPLPSLRVPDGSRSGPKNINEDGTSQEYPESEDTSPRRSIPPYPVPHIVGEYPGVCPEDEERGSGAEPEASHQWRYLKYVLTGILSVRMIYTAVRIMDRPDDRRQAAVIALIYTFAPIRDCMPKR